MVIDFGNGITAGGTSRDAVRIAGHSGLEVPGFETAVIESGSRPGGRVGMPRATTRRMTVLLDFGRSGLTRNDVLRAFRPGPERTISSDRGAMPYQVDNVAFSTDNLKHEFDASISMVSPLAYPLQAGRYIDTGGTGGLEYPAEYPLTYDEIAYEQYLYVDSGTEVPCAIRLTATLAGASSELLIAIAHRVTVLSGAFAAGDVVEVDSGNYSVKLNGVSDLDLFDTSGAWPVLESGTNMVAVSEPARIQAVWYPESLGLL